jgi:hypothetical protein
MKSETKPWTKTELKIYVLLLSAEADTMISEDELSFIKSKTDPETFDRIYQEFSKDDEDTGLEKIQSNVENHEYSIMELSQLKKEVHELFLSDKKMATKEHNIDRILDNILY